MEPYILIKESMHKTHNKEKMKIKSHLGTWNFERLFIPKNKRNEKEKVLYDYVQPGP